MQIDPIKPKLRPPETKRLKLKYDGLLSNFGFKFNVRRYNGGRDISELGVGHLRADGQTLHHGRALLRNSDVGGQMGIWICSS